MCDVVCLGARHCFDELFDRRLIAARLTAISTQSRYPTLPRAT